MYKRQYFSSSSYFIVDDLTFDVSVGQSENKQIQNIVKSYPNPTNSLINLYCSSSNSKFSEIEIFNEFGVLVSKNIINAQTAQLDVRDYPCGLYFYKVIFENNLIYYNKFIKN